MATNLHARKKRGTSDIEEAIAAWESSSPISGGTGKRKRKRGRFSEWQVAVAAVGGFLMLGLGLGYLLLHHQHRHAILHVMRDPWAHGGAVLRGRAGFRHHFYSGSPRSVTVVLPSVVNPAQRLARLQAIQDTWGPYARAIYVVHNVTEFPAASHAVLSEESTPEDPYSFPQLLLVPDSIAEDQGLPRLYHTLRTIYEKVNPDFALFVNDHTFVLPEHVCSYLNDRSPDEDWYSGHALHNQELVFNSGAAGYLLSRSAMRKIVQGLDTQDANCWLGGADASKWLQGNPALVTTKCLASMGIVPGDSRANGRYHRFHAFPLIRMVLGQLDDWYYKKHERFARTGL